VALVIVLAMLVLITALVMAFFSSVTTDFSSSKTYANGESAKQLADSAVNVVMSQIKDATAGFVTDASGTPDTSRRLAWASQPGMIRTWDDSGNPNKEFKLYSSGNMVVAGAYDPTSDTELTDISGSSWKDQPAFYTDLNSPVATVSGGLSYLSYPILAPPDTLDPTNGVRIDTTYSTTGVNNGVQGFNITSPPGFSGGNPSPTNNPAPMPVKWIYVLRDGTLAPATGSGTTANVATATASNPIVGRIAFWADDETCKVNINTASEGIYWDQPRGSTIYERGINTGANGTDGDGSPTAAGPELGNQTNGAFGFGWALPFTNEFQRTPGHPAMVCLSTVFGAQLPRPPVISGSNYLQIEKYYTPVDSSGKPNNNLAWPAPRTVDGGSKGGTQLQGINTNGAQISGGSPAMNLGNARLYSSVDEFMFDPARTVGSGTISAANVRADHFFLTANSRAPEVTLWNTPRMSVWPLFPSTSPNTTRTPKDTLLAFCSTTGTPGTTGSALPYYFTRDSAFTSAASPGSSQSPTTDINLPRNTLLYNYLSGLLSSNVPGIGGKVGGTSSQVGQTLTEVFDYIRSYVNAFKTAFTATGAVNYSYTPSSGQGVGSVVPMDGPNKTHGFGRTATLKDITMVFYAADIDSDYSDSLVNGKPPTPLAPLRDADGNPYQMLDSNGKPVLDVNKNPVIVSSNPDIPAFSKFPTDPMNTPAVWVDPSNHSKGWSTPPSDPSDPNGQKPKRIPYTKKIGLALVPSPFMISPGAPAADVSVQFQISGLTTLKGESVSGQDPVQFFAADSAIIGMKNNASRTPLNYFLTLMLAQSCGGPPRDPTSTDAWTGFNGMIGGPVYKSDGSFLSGTTVPITPSQYNTAKGCPDTFHFDGGSLKVDVMDGLTGKTTIQTIYVTVPPGDFPVPTLRRALSYNYNPGPNQTVVADAMCADPGTDRTTQVFYTGMDCGYNPMVFSDRSKGFLASPVSSPSPAPTATPLPAGKGYGSYPVSGFVKRGDTVRSVQVNTTTFPFGDMRLVAGLKTVLGSFFGGRPDQLASNAVNQYNYTDISQPTVPQAHSMLLQCQAYPTAGYSTVGQTTQINGVNTVTRGTFMPDQYPPDVNKSGHSYTEVYEQSLITGSVYPGVALTATNWTAPAGPTSLVPYGLSGAYMNGTSTFGDFDNGFGNLPDGPYVNKTDEVAGFNNNSYYWNAPDRCYYPDDNATFAETGASFTPSRQIASAVQFGSLPSRLDPSSPTSSTPWQTLLFCPNPAAGSAHKGFGSGSGNPGPSAVPPYSTAPDHVWLDLFWMPVVEPYAISEPFSTAGKVNLNQQLMPFGGYIERTTALRAVLKPIQLAAIPTAGTMVRPLSGGNSVKLFKYSWNQQNNQYGIGPWNANTTPWDFRYLVNLGATIDGFKARYGNGTDAFHSASEVCNIFLVPQQKPGSTYDTAVPVPPTTYDVGQLQRWWAGTTGTGMKPDWSGTLNNGFLATGDNTREAPYNHIYPLVTTKSNSFQVHYRVQLLQKLTNSDQTLWVEGKDQVVSEYRGSTILERYIDPNDPRLPDFAKLIANSPGDPAAVIDKYYRFRVVSTKAFTP